MKLKFHKILITKIYSVTVLRNIVVWSKRLFHAEHKIVETLISTQHRHHINKNFFIRLNFSVYIAETQKLTAPDLMLESIARDWNRLLLLFIFLRFWNQFAQCSVTIHGNLMDHKTPSNWFKLSTPGCIFSILANIFLTKLECSDIASAL